MLSLCLYFAVQGVGYQEKIDTGIKEFRIFFCSFFS